MAGPVITRELERKLEPPDGFDLAALAGMDPTERRFTSAYWDTEGGTLRRAGLTLRRRTEDRTSLWQLKLPAGDARTEVEARGGVAPPEQLVALLPAHLALGGPLRELARLRTRRRAVELVDGRARVEVAHDAVDVLDGRRKVAGFSELELELKYGDPKALKALAKQLHAKPAPSATKLDRALGPPPPAPESRLAEMLRAQVDAFLAHDPGARLADDPEDVHQLRVALRRVLACLRGGAEWIEPGWAEAVRPEVHWLLHELGPARDADVFHLWLRGQAEALGPDGQALRRLDGRLGRVRAEGHETARAALDDPRAAALLVLLDSPQLLDGEPTFRALARSETGRMRRLARKAGKHPEDELLHKLRLRGKRARYALELAQPELGKRGKEALAAARQLQDVLGEHQDAVQAELRLRDLARSTRGATAVALGRLVELQNERRRAAVRGFARAWSRFDDAAARI